MILYKDFENIFRDTVIFDQFMLTKKLFETRNDEDMDWKYRDARKKLKHMVENAK